MLACLLCLLWPKTSVEIGYIILISNIFEGLWMISKYDGTLSLSKRILLFLIKRVLRMLKKREIHTLLFNLSSVFRCLWWFSFLPPWLNLSPPRFLILLVRYIGLHGGHTPKVTWLGPLIKSRVRRVAAHSWPGWGWAGLLRGHWTHGREALLPLWCPDVPSWHNPWALFLLTTSLLFGS
jgi:hypothetical protein